MQDFAAIYQEYQPKIQRFLTRYVGEADAPDLTQMVFLKVSRSLETFRGESSLSTWIYRIATNTALDHAGSASTRQREIEDTIEPDMVENLADADIDGSDQRLIREEMSNCIRGMVDRLPENYRTVLLLSELEDLSNPEIAAILDLSVETVKIRLHRGRARLRSSMQSRCSFYRDERNALMCDRR